MPDFIVEYDMLEAIAEYSKALGKRAEEYAESLEHKLLSGIEGITGPSSGYLERAADSVRDKIKALKQKSHSFYEFAEQITNLLETAERIDLEVADAIAAHSINSAEHKNSLRLGDWKVLMESLILQQSGTNFFEALTDLLKAMASLPDSLADAIKHWYENEGRQVDSRQVTLPVKVQTREIALYDLLGTETKEKGIFSLFTGDAFWLLKYGESNCSGLNYSTKNDKVDLKANIKQENTATKDSSVWSVTGNFFGGIWDGVKDTGLGIVDVVLHPVKTAENLGTAVKHPLKTGEAIVTEIKDAFEDDIINGTSDTRARFIGNALSQVALSVIGTKGLDKATKAIKASNAAKAAKVAEELEESSSKIGKAVDSIAEAAEDSSKAGKEMEAASDAVTKGSGNLKPQGLIDELANSGVKYNPDDVVAVTKTADGKIVWLENGNHNAGLDHILNHADDFAAQGISKSEISNYVMDALENGKIVGYQGRGTGRPIYEFTYNGEVRKVAITTGNNGFVVGANPVSTK